MSGSEPTEPRRVCPRCRRPESVCYCDSLTRIDTETQIILLQHPRERDMPIGTARMAHLCLPNSALLVGFDWENSRELAQLLADPARQTALLFPGPDATDLGSLSDPKSLTLVVVDGTWANTNKMVRKNPILASLPRVSFNPERPSEYRIRREPRAQYVSTIEALMYVLGALEGGAERFEALLRPFRKMVDTQLTCKAERCSPRSRYQHAKPSPRLPIPGELVAHPERIVCVGGEANAWPCRDVENRSAYPDEVVQWVARRLTTGEVFECFAAPCHPVSPSTPAHLDVSAETLRAGVELPVLLERWRQFVRDDDIICTWGRYATSLFVENGGFLPQTRFDLRLVVKHLLKRNVGTMEEYAATLAPAAMNSITSTRTIPGRAGVRLEQLARIVEHLTALARCSAQVP